MFPAFLAATAVVLLLHASVPGWDDPVLYPPEVAVSDAVEGGELRVGEPDASGVQRALVLEHSSVSAVVSAGLVDVTLVQWFHNPFEGPVDATYLLPLPEGAAVNRLRLTCGERVVDGFVAEREEARALYDAARAEGRKAALLEQQRDNLFRQSVSNLCPGEEVEIEVGWVEQASLEDGVYGWTMPLTVGPRFSPPWVDDAEALVTPYAHDGRRVDVSVAIEEGLPVLGLWSDTHAITVVNEGAWGAELELADGEVVPDQDFALEWTLGGEAVTAALVVDRSDPEGDGYVALTVEPPGLGELDPVEVRPRELVFLIDQSCSMSGEPYDVAKAAVAEALRTMRPRDTFNLVRFSNDADVLFEEAQPSTAASRSAAAAWLERYDGGGTQMEVGLRAALAASPRPNALRMVLLLTDGFVGDDDTIGQVVRDNLGGNRVFALGVSSSPNRALLARVAEMGRGSVMYHRPGASIRRAVQTFFRRIDRPALTDVRVDWGDLDVFETYPSRVPDLWSGQVLRVVGRLGRTDLTDAEVTVSGFVGRRYVTLPVRLELPASGEDRNPGVAALWARRKVADLDSPIPGHATGWRRDEIVDVALEHGLVTRYTSLVAIDEVPGACGPSAVTVEVPAALPVDMDPAALGLLGTRGYGLGGGGTGFGMGSGGFGMKGRGSARSAQSTGDALILGGLDRSLIDDVIKRNVSRVRYCYEAALRKEPGLVGKVRVSFTIAGNGSVSEAGIKESTLGSPDVEACITRVFRALTFPAPAGGGSVKVTYPFVFSAP
jgi:Ca-activated chloride channel family protein